MLSFFSLALALIFCVLWRIELKERKNTEIELKISENTKNFWAGKAIDLDNLLREKLQVGLGDNRPIDFGQKLDEKLQNCKQ